MALTATLGSELQGAAELGYVLRALFEPPGVRLDIREQPGVEVLLEHGGRSATLGVQVLREAFESISGRCERTVPKDHLGRTLLRVLKPQARQPIYSQWAFDVVRQLAPQWVLDESPGHWKVHLTHDVDRVVLWEPVGLCGRLVRWVRSGRGQRSRGVGGGFDWMVDPRRLERAYARVMDMEKSVGAAATYFFMSGLYSLRRYGCRGGRPLRNLRRLVEAAKALGHRIGLHGSVYGLKDDDYGRRRTALESLAGMPVTWHRNHYLVYDAQASPGAYARGGIEVDSTCGFADGSGFRAGLAWPYELWDLGRHVPSGVVEIPLVFMDPDLLQPQVWQDLRQTLELCRKVRGEVAILFHVDSFVRHPQAIEDYAQLLDYLRQNGADLTGEPINR